MKNTIYSILILALVLSCKEKVIKENKTVFIKGTISNYDKDTLLISNITSKLMFFEENTHAIPLTDKANFTYSLELDKPAYFRINETLLYLSPGDDLTVNLDLNNNEDAKRDNTYFKGKGAEANNYLEKIAFFLRKPYSSINNPRVINAESYKVLPEILNKEEALLLKELNALTNISEDFKNLEKARLRFNYVNSLQFFSQEYHRNKEQSGEMSKEEFSVEYKKAFKYFIPYIKKHLKDFNNINYLQLDAFYYTLPLLSDDEFITKHNLPELSKDYKEYDLVHDLLAYIDEALTNTPVKDLNNLLNNVNNKYCKKAIKDRLMEYKLTEPGQPATDLRFMKLDGSTLKLSDYKGKLIVIDLWATWCGPCMKEKPFFDKLAKQFENNKNIEFISLSLDEEEVWKQYFKDKPVKGNQFLQTDSKKLKSNYNVILIPRFFVIGKDFNIIDIYAPVPSSGELEKLINKHI